MLNSFKPKNKVNEAHLANNVGLKNVMSNIIVPDTLASDTPALARLASANIASNNIKSIYQLERLEKKYGKSAETLKVRGMLHYNKREYKKASFYLEKSVEQEADINTLKPLVMCARNQGDQKECEAIFAKYAEKFRENAEFWHLSGLIFALSEKWDQAINDFKRASSKGYEFEYKNVEMLIKCLRNAKRHDELFAFSKKELERGNIDIITVEGFVSSCAETGRNLEATEFLSATEFEWKQHSRLTAYAAMLYYRLDYNIAENEKLNALALDLDPSDVKIRWNLALAQLRCGKIKEGIENYKIRFQWDEFPSAKRKFNKPQWTKAAPYDARIMIWTEQGIGDEIVFATAINKFQALYPNLIFETHPKTLDIMENSFPEVKTRHAIFREKDLMPLIEDFDFHLPLGDLFLWMLEEHEDLIQEGHSIAETNFLKPDFLRKKYWENKINKTDGRPKIGFCWSSVNVEQKEKYRGFTRAQKWLPLLSRDDVDFISIQYNFDYDDLEQELGEVRDCFLNTGFLDQMDDLEGALALISNLDLVITPASSPYTIASAAGIETWLYQRHSKFMLGRGGKFVTSPIFSNQLYYHTDNAFSDEQLVEDFNTKLDIFVSDFNSKKN